MRTVLAVRHVPHESLGTLENALAKHGLAWRYVDWQAAGARSTAINSEFRLDELCGLVVLGGPMNVDQTDRYPFLATDVAWLRRALDAELPVLGICLGAQLLAKALGARVYPNPVKEIGWYTVEMTPAAASDRLFANCRPSETVFQWHGDTFDLPPGAVHLASSAQCRHQAFRFDNFAYALQFHWEVTAAMIDEWLREPDNCRELASLLAIDAAEIRRRTPDELPKMSRVADQVLGQFVEMCRART